MKVSELFQISQFHEFKLAAGEMGTDREVRNVNMMDAPDIIDYLKPDDLLITTGYHLQHNPRFFYQLVEQMAERGCAALGIKTRRFIGGIPAEVIELANKLSFPLIDLPNSLALVDIVNQTLTMILDARTKELQFAIDTHQQFTRHIMSGESIGRLLKRLSDMIGFPAVLLDSYFKIIDAPAHEQTGSKITVHLPAVEQAFFQQQNAGYSSFSIVDTHQTLSLFVLYTYKKKRYFLLIGGFVPQTDRLLTLTVEQALNVLAFELMKDEALKQSDRKVRDAFFSNLVLGSFSTEEEIISRAKEFGFKDGRTLVCIAGELDTVKEPISFIHFQMETNDIYEYLEGEISTLPFPGHLFVKDHICVLIVEMMTSQENGYRFLKPYLQKLQDRVRHFFPQTLSFGLSNIFNDLPGIPDAYQEAVDALHAGMQIGRRSFIQAYQARGIVDLLHRIPAEDLRKLYQETLQSLAFPQKEENQDLLHTLYVYLESNCQISETAKKLYVHRNTVIYRIDKCEHILGRDLKDPDTTFQLRFALRLKPLIDNSEGISDRRKQ
ncbi:PucR family transcriptional regulator [Sporolactobacillus pectinivorans]|uniref:PucR family transcriptional regulator n=1 Tax=Sporolactobacillus pectinivorans TaxID=1591408 RepID=UPI000C257F54|nr:PucR family transcriptional regulator [Sporolactobacillus pectinivorans]